MYCIQCGVKLSDSEKQCPLCGLTVYHPELTQPEAEPLYPSNRMPGIRRRSFIAQVFLTVLFLIPMNVVLVCDTQLSGSITWSGYVVGALILSYVVMILPLWFSRPNPVIFVPCDFAATALLLLYIDLCGEGGWFLSFALPVTGFFCLLVTTVVTLMRYVPKGGLYIFGGATIALGVFLPVMEYLMMLTFGYPKFIGWSLYPMVGLLPLGGLLIFLAICRPARETMERKLFI